MTDNTNSNDHVYIEIPNDDYNDLSNESDDEIILDLSNVDKRKQFFYSIHRRKLIVSELYDKFINDYFLPDHYFSEDILSIITEMNEEEYNTLVKQNKDILSDFIRDIIDHFGFPINKFYLELQQKLKLAIEYISNFTLWTFKNNLTVKEKIYWIAVIEIIKKSELYYIKKIFTFSSYTEKLLNYSCSNLSIKKAIMMNKNYEVLEYFLNENYITNNELFEIDDTGFSLFHLSVIYSVNNMILLFNKNLITEEEFHKKIKNTDFNIFMLACESGSLAGSYIANHNYATKEMYEKEFYLGESCLSVSALHNSKLFSELINSKFFSQDLIKRKNNFGQNLLYYCFQNTDSILILLNNNLLKEEYINECNSVFRILNSIRDNTYIFKKILEFNINENIIIQSLKEIFLSKSFIYLLQSKNCKPSLFKGSNINTDNSKYSLLKYFFTESNLIQHEMYYKNIIENIKNLLDSNMIDDKTFLLSYPFGTIQREEIFKIVIESKYVTETFIKSQMIRINSSVYISTIYKFLVENKKIYPFMFSSTNFIKTICEYSTDIFKEFCKYLTVDIIKNYKIVEYLLENNLIFNFLELIKIKNVVNLLTYKDYYYIIPNYNCLKKVLTNQYLDIDNIIEKKIHDIILEKSLNYNSLTIKLVIDTFFKNNKPNLTNEIFDIFIKSINFGIKHVETLLEFDEFNDSIYYKKDSNNKIFLHYAIEKDLEMVKFFKNIINPEIVNCQDNNGNNCLFHAINKNLEIAHYLIDENLVNELTFSQKENNNYTTFFRVVATDDIKLIEKSLKYINKTIFDTKVKDNRSLFSFVTDSFLKDETLLTLVNSEFFDKESIMFTETIKTEEPHLLDDITIHLLVKLIINERTKTVIRIIKKLDLSDIFYLEDELNNNILILSYKQPELYNYLLNHKYMTQTILEKSNKNNLNILLILSNYIDVDLPGGIQCSDLLLNTFKSKLCRKEFICSNVYSKNIINVTSNINLLTEVLLLVEEKIDKFFIYSAKKNNASFTKNLLYEKNYYVIQKFIKSSLFDYSEFCCKTDFLQEYTDFEIFCALFNTDIDSDKSILNYFIHLITIDKNKVIDNLFLPSKTNNLFSIIIKYSLVNFFRTLLSELYKLNVELKPLLKKYNDLFDLLTSNPIILKIFINSNYFTEDLLLLSDYYNHNGINKIINNLEKEDYEIINLFSNKTILNSEYKYAGDIDNDRISMWFVDNNKEIKEKFKYLINIGFIDKKLIELENNNKDNSLLYYVQKKSYNSINLILDNFYSQNIISHTNYFNKNFLHYVFSDKYLMKKILKKIINKDISSHIYYQKDIYGYTPLHYAIKNNISEEYFSKILDQFTTDEIFNIKDNDGNTLLLYCAEYNRKYLNYFYTHRNFTNKNLILRDNRQNSILYKLIDSKKDLENLFKMFQPSIELLYKYHTDNGSCLIIAAKDYTDTFKFLLDNYDYIPLKILEARNEQFYTILHTVCHYNVESFKYLIEKYPNIDFLSEIYTNSFIDNPFIYACKYNPEIINYICSSKISGFLYEYLLITEKSTDKEAYLIAFESQPLAIIYLIKSGLSLSGILNKPYSSGYTILNHITIGNPEIKTLNDFISLEYANNINEETENDNLLCDICMNFKKKIQFIGGECQHITCVACAIRVKKCPLCREIIDDKKVVSL